MGGEGSGGRPFSMSTQPKQTSWSRVNLYYDLCFHLMWVPTCSHAVHDEIDISVEVVSVIASSACTLRQPHALTWHAVSKAKTVEEAPFQGLWQKQPSQPMSSNQSASQPVTAGQNVDNHHSNMVALPYCVSILYQSYSKMQNHSSMQMMWLLASREE